MALEPRYRPLIGPDAIRLLLLQPAASHDAGLEGTLLHTTLSACDYDLIEPYTALSYVWGDAARPGRMRVDGQDGVAITATLDAALRDLRDGVRVRRVWADALCIDQSNVAERNKQVALMGRIYAIANHTVIHLGALTTTVEQVLEASRRMAQDGGSVSSSEAAQAVASSQQDLLNRPWFGRVWVFQELVLSKDAWVQCGDVRTRWQDLCRLLVPAGAGQGHNLTPSLQVLRDMNSHRQHSIVGTLFGLLMSRRGLGATDPRDFVYAHLGLAADMDRVQRYLQVDYGKPVVDTFSRAARYLVDTVGIKTVLLHLDGAQLAERREGLPSWAPDWSRDATYSVEMYVDNMISHVQLSGSFQTFVEASSSPILAHLGYDVDVIEHVGAVLPPRQSIVLPSVDEYRSAMAGLQAMYSGSYTSGDKFGRYTRVSLRGKEEQHEKLCQILSQAWVYVLRQMASTSPGPEHAQADNAFLDSVEAWLMEESKRQRIFTGQDAEGAAKLFYEYMHPNFTGRAVLEGRRLAMTRMGKLAVVPSSARAEDTVAYLAGNNVAVIVRPSGENEKGKLDQVVVDAVRDSGLCLRASDTNLDWDASGRNVMDITHCFAIGQGYVDGVVGWALRLPPDHEQIRIYAIH